MADEPQEQSIPTTASIHFPRMQVVLLAGLWLIVGLLVVPTWGLTYWDFGDGNYLYVGRRINEGLVPYRDILAPQPPLHLLLSAWSQRIGSWFGNDLYGARTFSLLVRFAQSALVYLAAFLIFRCGFRAIVAATLYLFLYIGFWWSLCIQSENIEIVFLLMAFCSILTLDKKWVYWGGAASALAMHCNMTAVPYFMVNALFLLCRRRELWWRYVAVALGVFSIGAVGAYAWAGHDYLDNVLFNQVGSFPREEILGRPLTSYAREKITSQGANVLRTEGLFIIAAAIALMLGTRDVMKKSHAGEPDYLRWEYAAWSALGMWLSIGFTAKGGTVDYIFVLGEPAVAIFCADFVVRVVRLLGGVRVFLSSMGTDRERRHLRNGFAQFFRASFPPWREMKELSFRNTLPFLRLLFSAVAVGLLVVCVRENQRPGFVSIKPILTQQQSEFPDEGVAYAMEVIDTYSRPGDEILAPPFYAYVSHRRVAGELAENYLWHIKWINEFYDMQNGLGDEGAGILKFQEIGAALRAQRIPLVMLDMKITAKPPIIAAITEFYEPAPPNVIQTRNAELRIFVPKGKAPPVSTSTTPGVPSLRSATSVQ